MSTLTEYKCPNCGGAVEFNSTTQNMKCPFCDSEFSVEAIEAENEANRKISSSTIEWNGSNSVWGEEKNGLKVYLCNSCGGEIVCDENTTAAKCPYCDSNVTVKGAFDGELKPDLIIPFKLNKEEAKKRYMSFISGKPFLPDDFKDKNHIDEIKGVYVPEWLFDCRGSAQVLFDATKIRTWTDKKYKYTDTSHYNVYRSCEFAFSGIPVDGSSKMDDALMESIEPFDRKEAVDFKAAYLAGYMSEKYDENAEYCIPRAKKRIDSSAAGILRSSVGVGYTSVIEKNVGVNTSESSAKYALYPVWLLNTTYEGKKYVFAMNGQSGKFVGDLPLNRKKLYGVAAGIFAAVTAALSVISYFIAF